MAKEKSTPKPFTRINGFPVTDLIKPATQESLVSLWTRATLTDLLSCWVFWQLKPHVPHLREVLFNAIPANSNVSPYLLIVYGSVHCRPVNDLTDELRVYAHADSRIADVETGSCPLTKPSREFPYLLFKELTIRTWESLAPWNDSDVNTNSIWTLSYSTLTSG